MHEADAKRNKRFNMILKILLIIVSLSISNQEAILKEEKSKKTLLLDGLIMPIVI